MLSPEAKKRAEEHLAQIEKEIAAFVPAQHAPWGREYLRQLTQHRELWLKFLGR
jgi:hypothetical protein